MSILKTTVCILLLCHIALQGLGQTIRYVKPIASGTGDGSSWANASGNLKAIIDGAASNTQIWVAAGTYKPTTGTDRNVSFVMKNGVAIYGGFAGTETLLSQRNWAVNKTILSGDIGTADNIADNSYHVICNSSNSLVTNAILDGFTITLGNSNGQGGGIYNYESGPWIANCIITGNRAVEGGGAANLSAKAFYFNCSIYGNLATGKGGGMLNYKCPSPPTLTNCTISGNQASGGGGVYNYLAATFMTNCISWGNSTEIINEESSPQVTYSLVQGGYAGTGNIAADPKFIAQPAIGLGTKGNLRLQPCSPAINAGSNGANSTTLDLAGNARKTLTIDMGAYERPAAAASGVMFVDDNGPADGGDGSNWANAFTSLQDAISTSSCAGITQIWVAAGTYKPTTGTDRLISFVMKNNLGIYGGFAGTETLLAQRDRNTNLTILSGDIGVVGDISDNSYHLVMNQNNGLNATAVLDGFTLTLGNANGSSQHAGGAGIRNASASPTISHCTFSQNTAVSGAALYNANNSSPVITGCIFKENEATIGSGGGTLVNINVSSAIITNCSFIGNKAGGAMVNNTSAPVITNCSFIGNQSTISGGGMYNFNASPVIINCSFSGNQAATSGGAIYNNYISVPTISNSIFYGNSSEIFNAGFSSVVTYSIIQGGYAGTGNLDVNPQFVQQPPVGLGITGNLRLQNCSPAQDAGNDAALAGTTDFDGNPRKFNGNARPNDIDMGAYEIQSICCPPANILYVKANATGSNSGSSWANAYTSLQDALAQTSLCASVTQIWVAAGTYKPTTGTNRSISFAMKNNLAIYGGFAGTETLLAERNWNNNITILSGDIGAAGNPSDNSLHVIANSNLDATAIIDGFQISNGNANANDDVNESGGGVWNAMASPTFSNCVFSVNLAGFGGAMANQDNSSPVITNCIFIKNSATLGGAVYNTNQSSPNITFSRFSGNRANYSGGAINNRTNASPVVTNCVFIGNSANLGGALDNNGQSSPIITNCSFSGNVSDQASGAAIYNTQSSPQFTNCIIWGNTAAIVNEFSASPVVNYSIVQGGYGGTGNLDTDPQFVQQPPIIQGTAGDLRLQPCSPAQDAGNDAANTMTTDFAGYARKFNGKGGSNDIDMGAYELQTICCPPADILYVNANATGANNGSSWANAFTSLQDALAHTNLCGSVNQLWVAAGTYKPTTGTDRTISFVMKNNLGIYGGFAGSETQLVQRNWNTNLCILSGDIGESGNFADNSYHVVRNLNNGLDTTAVLDGFSISGGNGNDVVEIVNSRGGGIYNQSASPVISNCYFSGNRASSGGAIFNANASPYISSCTFSSNMVTGAGGAVCNTVSTVSISNCNFSGNQSIEGGALYFWKSSCNIINCSFSGNTATNRGGGIYSYNTPYTITNCSFSGNQAETGGGLYTNGDPFNCLVMNCIVYGNSNGNITKYATANTTVSYSIVQGGYTGTGNLNIDPMFVQQPPAGLGTTGNLRLLPCSPAINMGNDMDNGTPIDLDNNNRKFGTIDMGAYERQTAIPIIWYLDSAATGNGDGTSWANAFTNLGTALSQLKHCSATDTLFIAKGTYQSNVPFEFDKLQGVILGGYPTGGGTRNAVANPVIVQGVVNVRKSMRIDGLQVTGQQL